MGRVISEFYVRRVHRLVSTIIIFAYFGALTAVLMLPLGDVDLGGMTVKELFLWGVTPFYVIMRWIVYRASFRKLKLVEAGVEVYNKNDSEKEIIYFKDINEVLFRKKIVVLKLKDNKSFEVKFETIEYAYSVAGAIDAKVKNEKK